MPRIPIANLRLAEREVVALPVSLVLRSEGRQASYEASTINLSLGGACIQTHLKLEPGEWVGIVPKGEFPHAIPSRVVWVRQKDDSALFFLTGLQFSDTLPV
jgi:hypothetical protein